ncbi:MAG TPA: hypothetical protein VD846_00240 [Allosphingosinicella sp.]|nr:hypothetical protein [Allosphingosinicella sp.]
MIGRVLASVLLFAATGGAPAQEPAPPATEADHYPARLRFPAATDFVEAIGLEDQAGRIIDSFWRPAASALVAANPVKAEAARRFAAAERARELAVYLPTVALIVDNEAVELLNPELVPQLEALLERGTAEHAGSRGVSGTDQLAYAEGHRRITAAAAARANGDLLELARLARTPDGMALRELQRRGFYQCELLKDRGELPSEIEAECAKITSPAVARLRASPLGARLIRLSTYANAQLMATVAMSHAPGISLHRLLSPEKVRAAGLAVPPDGEVEMLPPDGTARP